MINRCSWLALKVPSSTFFLSIYSCLISCQLFYPFSSIILPLMLPYPIPPPPFLPLSFRTYFYSLPIILLLTLLWLLFCSFHLSVPVSPTTTQYVLSLIAHLIISSISLFHLLSLISLHIDFFFAPTLVFPLSSIFTHRSSSFVFLKAVFLNLTLQTFLLLCLFLCFRHRHLAITASLFFLFFLSLSSPSFSNLQFFHLPSMFSFVHLFSPCPSYLSPAGSLFPSAISPPSKCSVSPALQQSAVHRFPRAHCCIPTEACTAFSHK